MKNVTSWFLRPTVGSKDTLTDAWRLRVWAGLAMLIASLLLETLWGGFIVLTFIFVAYWLYAVARMMYARVRGVHVPSRQELLERYTDDPDAHV